MVVEIDDLLEVVMKEVLVFVDVNVVWLSKVLFVVVVVGVWESKQWVWVIFVVIVGVQFIVCSCVDFLFYDVLIDSYCKVGFLFVQLCSGDVVLGDVECL